MIGIILTIFFVPGLVEAQQACDADLFVGCINTLTDVVFNTGDVSNPALISNTQRDALCRARDEFSACVLRLPGCGGMDSVVRTQNQIYNATRLDLQELCGGGVPTTQVVGTTIKLSNTSRPWTTPKPWTSTYRPWTSTRRAGQGCSMEDVNMCMMDLMRRLNPNDMDTSYICPVMVDAVQCLNRLISCSNSMEYNDAVRWIEQNNRQSLCDLVVFPTAKGEAVGSFPLLIIVGLLSAMLAIM